jgi:undecaprenyl-diphosphatase
MDLIQHGDLWLFVVINNAAGRWPWLDALARLFLNDYFVPTFMAIILLALWFEGIHPLEQARNQKAVLVGSVSAALANTLLKMMNLLFYRPRPFAAHEVNLLFYQPTDSSLPSNAATLGFSIAAGVWFQRRRWGWLLLTIAALFGLSRILGGVHYPLDVVTGAALGCLSAWLVQRQERLVNALLALIIKLSDKLLAL